MEVWHLRQSKALYYGTCSSQECSKIKAGVFGWVLVVQAFNPSTQEAETRKSRIVSHPQSWLQIETLSEQQAQNGLETQVRNLPEWILPTPGVSCG
ncbi:hypothetical protein I79_020114 [Cricetulus griseus]|uniref:Uncharacterized protein n=1 Tax=Cricetulus griseus TaxID=10029 RepID=G3I981_CRIGR|nr:hypothetical protein I79_020114 [Cricetulus griseus]